MSKDNINDFDKLDPLLDKIGATKPTLYKRMAAAGIADWHHLTDAQIEVLSQDLRAANVNINFNETKQEIIIDAERMVMVSPAEVAANPTTFAAKVSEQDRTIAKLRGVQDGKLAELNSVRQQLKDSKREIRKLTKRNKALLDDNERLVERNDVLFNDNKQLVTRIEQVESLLNAIYDKLNEAPVEDKRWFKGWFSK
ncbi:hypothetical protein [Weissella cibaria]|uniref:hypothetical protein n=1 Tax=Weissella cibaria TaxID=137591 RepID=UPI00106E738E|nr:hypothetical protein [Weissella cibaria]